MRCNSCEKFVSQEAGEPEVDIDISEGHITGSVRITQCCAECSQELKEYNLDVDQEATLCDEADHTHTVEVEDVEETSRTEGKGRYTKTFYGAAFKAVARCKECDLKDEITPSDDVPASDMEECQ